METKLEENKKLERKLKALETDYKIFQDSRTGLLRSRRNSISCPNTIAQLFQTSPRTLMSSLQDKSKTRFEGRSLFKDFEDAVDDYEPLDEIEDLGSGKDGISDGSCSGSCLSEEKFEGWASEKVVKDECRRGFYFSKLVVVMVLIGVILGIIYMMGVGVFGDEVVTLLPT